MLNALTRASIIGLGIGLAGCTVYETVPAYYGYAPPPAYYPPPVYYPAPVYYGPPIYYAPPVYGGFAFFDGGWHRHWR